MPSSGST